MKYKKWSENDLLYIKHHYATISDKILAQNLSENTGENITASMVRRQRRNLEAAKSRGRPRKYKKDDSGSMGE